VRYFAKQQHTLDVVRTGKAIYSLLNSNEFDIKTAVSVIAKIRQVIEVYPGSTIGYNKTFEANQTDEHSNYISWLCRWYTFPILL